MSESVNCITLINSSPSFEWKIMWLCVCVYVLALIWQGTFKFVDLFMPKSCNPIHSGFDHWTFKFCTKDDLVPKIIVLSALSDINQQMELKKKKKKKLYQ